MPLLVLAAAAVVAVEAGVAPPDVATCYRRMDIDLAECANYPGEFDMRVFDRASKSWSLHPGLNCFGGSGARTVPGPEPFPSANTPITLAACQTGCASDPVCTGIVTSVFLPAPPPPPPGGIKWNPGEQIPGPAAGQSVEDWKAAMDEWRKAARGPWFKGTAYNDPQLKWTQNSWIQPQMHPYDRLFFDETIGTMGNYTVQKWLNDVNARYGGVDSILMWPTYTNIGIDDRSQFDFFEAMPGGVAGVRAVVDELHAAGVKVLIPYNPWDEGTLRCGPGQATCGGNANLTAETTKNSSYCNGPATAANPGHCDARIMDSLIAEMNADGFNGDTMDKVPEEFYTVSTGIRHSVAIEPEGGGNIVDNEGANWDTMGWGYWGYPYVPSVDSWKWFDSRRMTNICERWSKDHTNALQYALFNGDGFESWENVWGTWNGITERDGEQIRRVAVLLRFLGSRGYLQSQEWIPHSPTADSANLFASFWPLDDKTAAWTVVNRNLTGPPHTGPALTGGLSSVPAGYKFYDLYNGVEIAALNGVLPLTVERFGAVLATDKGPDADPDLKALLTKMAGYAKTSIASLDPTWHYEYGARVKPARAESPVAIEGMVKIPGGPFRFDTHGIEIEGAGSAGDPRSPSVNPFGVDFQYEWEAQPNRFHTQWLDVPAYWFDVHPVTHAAFADYLAKNPKAVAEDRYHYLKNWDWSDPDMPKPHAGNETLPVTYVGIDEARGYCASVGKRLPHEEEWQFAATGGGDREQPYPWGYSDPDNTRAPQQITGTVFTGPEAVGKYPAGASPFGVQDMIGSVWQMTDEYRDTHTRSVILKGGCNYRPSGSMWYFPMTPSKCGGHCGWTTNQLHNKYFLMNSRYERAGTLGFRCAADVKGSDKLDCAGKPVCGRFDAPNASVNLTESTEWVLWDGSDTRHSKAGVRISDASASSPLQPCSGTQTTFTAGAVSTTNGTCLGKGSAGILFHVAAPATAGQESTLSVYAGASGSAAMLTATLVDGGQTMVYQEYVNVTAADSTSKVYSNLKWQLKFTPKSANAVLTVNVSGPMLPAPPPPPSPPPPPPCTAVMCGALAEHAGDVDLAAVGTSDWTHYGLSSDATVNRKCAVGALIGALKQVNGRSFGFSDCWQTFSWSKGGVMAGAPVGAQVGSVVATAEAIYLGGPKGGPSGGYAFTVDIPEVTVDTQVNAYVGSCANQAVFSSTLRGASGRTLAYFNQTMSDTSCQWTGVVTLTVPPAKAGTGKRTLRGSWLQTAQSAASSDRNIQFHAIAVDAGGPVGGGGVETRCAHGRGGGSGGSGSVILQAVTLT